MLLILLLSLVLLPLVLLLWRPTYRLRLVWTSLRVLLFAVLRGPTPTSIAFMLLMCRPWPVASRNIVSKARPACFRRVGPR